MKRVLVVAMVLGLAAQAGVLASQARVRETRFRGLKAMSIENGGVKVVVLPGRGANVISLVDKRTGRDWIWHNPWDRYRALPYAAGFMDGDVSGYDDCFPTVGKQAYPSYPWKGVEMPDHGEVWALPWSYRPERGGLHLEVSGVRLPYRFERDIRLAGPRELAIRYRVTNTAPTPMEAIWAGHALVAVRPGMDVFLPASARFMDDLKPWSAVPEHGLQWIRLGGPETKSAKKAFTRKLQEGWGGFYDGKTREYLLYSFDPRKVPYFGLWINQGGLAVRGHRHYNVGLEPTTGGENFQHSREHGMRSFIPARSSVAWEVRVTLGRASRAGLYRQVRRDLRYRGTRAR